MDRIAIALIMWEKWAMYQLLFLQSQMKPDLAICAVSNCSKWSQKVEQDPKSGLLPIHPIEFRIIAFQELQA